MRTEALILYKIYSVIVEIGGYYLANQSNLQATVTMEHLHEHTKALSEALERGADDAL